MVQLLYAYWALFKNKNSRADLPKSDSLNLFDQVSDDKKKIFALLEINNITNVLNCSVGNRKSHRCGAGLQLDHAEVVNETGQVVI